jgi:hypothetical protein
VITVAGVAENVVGLVYVAGFVPDEGESLGTLQAGFPVPAAATHILPAEIPGGAEVTLDPAAVGEVFAADVDPADVAFMAIAQRPLAATAFEEPPLRRPGSRNRRGPSCRPRTPRSTPMSTASPMSARERSRPRCPAPHTW